MADFKNITGQRFGRLLVVRREGSRKGGNGALWFYHCDCGGEGTASSTHLLSGHTRSCGCLHKERARGVNLRHAHAAGRTKTPTYRTWVAMLLRCRNPNNDNYEYYGGRGIRVCERWLKFENFLADMGERPAGTSIDRIDNDGDYEPGNCRWATSTEQRLNRYTPSTYRRRRRVQFVDTRDATGPG